MRMGGKLSPFITKIENTMKNMYEIKFECKSYCYWTIEASNQEEAEKIAKEGNISDSGLFVEEEQKSYDFLSCALEQENI